MQGLNATAKGSIGVGGRRKIEQSTVVKRERTIDGNTGYGMGVYDRLRLGAERQFIRFHRPCPYIPRALAECQVVAISVAFNAKRVYVYLESSGIVIGVHTMNRWFPS